MEVLQYANIMNAVVGHFRAHEGLESCFNEFHQNLHEFLTEGSGQELFMEAELLGDGPAIQLRYQGGQVRFSFVTQDGDNGSIGVVVVHRLPRHAPFERFVDLGSFTFDVGGYTSLKQGDRYLDMKSRLQAAVIALHFVRLSAQAEFAGQPQK